MKKSFFLTIGLLATSLFTHAQNVEISYIGKVPTSIVCGARSGICQPTVSQYYTRVNGGTPYDGDPSTSLGVLFKQYHDAPDFCKSFKVTENDVQTVKTTKFKAKVETTKSTDFGVKAKADIMGLLKDIFNLSSQVKLDAEVALNSAVKNKTTQDIDLVYRSIILKKGVRMEHSKKCLAEKSDKDYCYATGIAVVSVSGSFTNDLLKDVLTKVEANLGYKNLTAEAKAAFDAEKKRLIEGTFEMFPEIVAVSYDVKG